MKLIFNILQFGAVRVFLCIMLIMACCPLMAQQVGGIVTDYVSGEPLIGVKVIWRGTSIGTTTNKDGHFTLKDSQNATDIVVSYTGYRSDTLRNVSGTNIKVRLVQTSMALQSVSVHARRKAVYSDFSSLTNNEVTTVEGLRGLACCNLGESFENSATVDVGYSDAVSGSKQIQLLGLTGVYSQILLENTPFLRGLTSPYGLGYVPGQWMESISVSKGVATVKNGCEAITGIINLEYEKPDKGDRFSLNLYENSDLKSEITTKFNHRFNDHLSTGLYLFGTYSGRRFDHIGHDGFADYPLQQQFNVVNRWDYEVGHEFHSQTLVNYIHESRLGGDMRFERSMRGNDSIYGFGGTSDRLYFMTKNGFMISNTASFGSQVSGSWFRHDAWYGLSEYKGEEKDVYVNLMVNAEVSGGHIVDYGASFRYSDMGEELMYKPYATATVSVFDPEISFVEVVPGVFGQYTFRYGDDFNATFGMRYDYNSHHERHLISPRLHARWHMGDQYVLRLSAGRGFRTSNVIAENIGLLASGRDIVFADTKLDMEEAWNGGINLNKHFTISEGHSLTVSIDYFHTSFVNQVVVDLDANTGQAIIGNLAGRSWSNVVQADVNIEPFDGFSVSLAGKINSVFCDYHGVRMRKPYTPFWKGLAVFTYHTRFDKWRFDFTTQLNGPQRLPLNKGTLQGEASPYIYMLGQITRRFKQFEVYVGVENITDYVQEIPVIGADNPFSQAFDASVVYAPLMGRLVYVGLRLNVM